MPLPSSTTFDRRRFLATAGLGVGWLGQVGSLLEREAQRSREPARSVILLWLGGGPSHLDMYDLKPGAPA